MNTIEEFLKKYVSVNGPSTVKMGGEPMNISIQGISETEFGTPDIYIVNQIGVDSSIAEKVKTFVFANDEGVSFNLRSEPQAAMRQARHSVVYSSDNLAVYSTDGDVLGVYVEPIVDDVYVPSDNLVGTTPSPNDLGVSFNITGAEDQDEDQDEDEDQGEPLKWSEPKVDPAW